MGDKITFRIDGWVKEALRNEAHDTKISLSRLCAEVLERYVTMTEPVETLRMRLAVEATGSGPRKYDYRANVHEARPGKRSGTTPDS